MMLENPFLCLPLSWPFIAAFISYLLGRRHEKSRDFFAILATGLQLILLLYLTLNIAGAKHMLSFPGFAGLGVHFLFDEFRALFAVLTAFLWLIAAIFSREYFRGRRSLNRYYCFMLLVQGTVTALFLSADFFTTFLFFELMSFASYPMVAQDESREALRSAATYLAVSVIGGLSMLMGLFLLHHHFATLDFTDLYTLSSGLTDRSALYLPGLLMLIGFGAKAGMFPLHIWLPKAHPAAPAPASALLSGILTKTGMFGIIAVSCNLFAGDLLWGQIILIPALITMVLGALLGVFSTDLKKTLACSSVSQIGFTLCGVAMLNLLGSHNAIAGYGVVLHMLNHSLTKLLLFSVAGIIYLNTHQLDLNQIRGYGRGKPFLTFLFLMGALSLSGVPLFSGYISKTLLHESIVEGVHLFRHLPLEHLLSIAEILFLVAGGLTVAYMSKLFIALFIDKPQHAWKERGYISASSALSLSVPALILPLLGSFPQLMEHIASPVQIFMHAGVLGHAIDYFAWINLRGALISLFIGVGVYLLIVRKLLMRNDVQGPTYLEKWPAWLDLEDLVYRPLLTACALCGGAVASLLNALPDLLLFRWLPLSFKYERDAEHSISNSFSFSLLLFGIGLSCILVFVFLHAMKPFDLILFGN